jgi:hypothetical protein
MIRRLIESAYRKTVGTLLDALRRPASSLVSGWGAAQVLYVVGIVALMAGFVNAVVLPVPNQAQAVYPGSGSQTLPETFIDAMVILLGGAGVYLTYASGKQTTKSRMVNLYLAIALLLVSATLITGVYLVNIKG